MGSGRGSPESLDSSVRRDQAPRVAGTREDRLRGRHRRLLKYERELWEGGAIYVAGLDEAGAGPLAGPVVAGCVALDRERTRHLVGVYDSKQLGAAQRETLAVQIRAHAAAFAVAEVSAEEIDRINIRQACLLAMRRAFDAVAAQVAVDHVLIDARALDALPAPQTAIIKGDASSLAIAAGSILAKTHRDALMLDFAAAHPGYGFEQHKGYATAEHREALRRLGPSPIHRRSYAPVRAALSPQGELFG